MCPRSGFRNMPPSAVIRISFSEDGRCGRVSEVLPEAWARSLDSGISTVCEKLRRSVSALPLDWRLCVMKFRVGARLAKTDLVRDARRASTSRCSLLVRSSGPVKVVASSLRSTRKGGVSTGSACFSEVGGSAPCRLVPAMRVETGPRMKPARDSR